MWPFLLNETGRWKSLARELQLYSVKKNWNA
jgi:hypothetical protein